MYHPFEIHKKVHLNDLLNLNLKERVNVFGFLPLLRVLAKRLLLGGNLCTINHFISLVDLVDKETNIQLCELTIPQHIIYVRPGGGPGTSDDTFT